MIALFSTAIPNFMPQDALAAPNISYSAETTTKNSITITFSEAMDSMSTSVHEAFTIDAGYHVVSSVTHVNGTATMILHFAPSLNESARPYVVYAELVTLLDTGSDGDTVVVGPIRAVDMITDSSTMCYDCAGPQLQEAQITISSDNYIVTPGDELTHITANVGDEISLLLKITDDRSIETIPFVGLYTNFIETPSDMSLFYANHYDNSQNISASFYEWNTRSDDIAFDYDGTVSWTALDDPIIGEYFITQFTMKFTDSMETSQIIVKSSDIAGNYSYETLPVTLEVIGDAPIDFDSNGKVLGFFNESILSLMILELNTSDNITTPISALLGLSDDALPAWTSDLAKWTAEDKITSGDLIVAAEYLINQ